MFGTVRSDGDAWGVGSGIGDVLAGWADQKRVCKEGWRYMGEV